MNRTLLDECFRVKGQETWYTKISEIQRDLDQSLDHYNTKRSHQGYWLQGHASSQALREALNIETLPPFVSLAELDQ